MELPFEKTVSRFWQQKLYAPVIREETQEYKLPEGMPDIERVIAAWGQVVLRGKEWRSHHIGLTGGVMVWAIYAAADGTVRRIESWMPFSARTDHSHEGEEGVIRAECVLSGVDARTASSRKLMLRCQLGLLVQTMVPRETTIYAPGELPGDIEVLERTYPMILTRETGEKSFLCEERLELPQGTGTIEQLLYYRLTPRVTEQKVLGSRAVFRGTGQLHLLCREEGGRLRSLELELPFAQYLDLEGDYEEEAEVSNLLAVTSLEAEPTDDGGIQVRCGLVSQYIINAPTVIRCLEDAYSPLRELELVREEVRLPAWLDEQVRQVELQERLAGSDLLPGPAPGEPTARRRGDPGGGLLPGPLGGAGRDIVGEECPVGQVRHPPDGMRHHPIHPALRPRPCKPGGERLVDGGRDGSEAGQHLHLAHFDGVVHPGRGASGAGPGPAQRHRPGQPLRGEPLGHRQILRLHGQRHPAAQ